MAEEKRKFKLEQWHKIAIMLAILDVFLLNLGYLAALWLRYDCMASTIPVEYLHNFIRFVPLHSLLCVGVYLAARLYQSIWRFASYTELLHIIAAVAVTMLLHIVLMSLLVGRMPISYYVLGGIFQLLCAMCVRFSYRIVVSLKNRHADPAGKPAKRVMLVGAGNAGQLILRDITLHTKQANVQICCIVDDNSNKRGRYIDGVPVVGGRQSIAYNVGKYQIEEIYFAIPSASAQQRRDILNICKDTGCQVRSLPSITQLASGEVAVKDLHDVAIEDLLGREPVQVDMQEIGRFLTGKTILVTGGGGSIGSELCRQIARYAPRRLIIFDVYENNVYEIEQELRRSHPELNLTALIGSVRDSRRLTGVFDTYRPDIVYHAAAHKHVPLMEESPCEAVKNNVIGTYKTAYAAMIYGCQRFVLISTDKAVNPTNIMGASKRLCEMVVQSFDRAIKTGTAAKIPMLFTHKVDDGEGVPRAVVSPVFCTEFVAVRFGNVLGSNGSVIPLFKKQIEQGGPVTVTHPEIIRYFMTIPEAVSLVLQAGTYAHGGEIFVLDMGVPVKIDTLARNLIKLSGFEPDVDIPIVYTGLRPGEKLYEEKLMAEEGLQKTDNSLIHIGNPIPFEQDKFLADLERLMWQAYDNSSDITDTVAKMVPTYRPEKGGVDAADETFRQLHEQAVGV